MTELHPILYFCRLSSERRTRSNNIVAKPRIFLKKWNVKNTLLNQMMAIIIKRDFQLLLAAFILHIIFFFAVFDIHFKSPILHGMAPVSIEGETPLAKRLVLFIADGLRVDKFYEYIDNTPHSYLRWVNVSFPLLLLHAVFHEIN